MKEDLGAEGCKAFSKLEATVARSIVLDGEISALQPELSVLLNGQLQMDIMCAVERYILHKIQQCNVQQTINSLATSLAEMIGEVLVIQTQGKTQQGVNTQVQHVVNIVEVETPKIIKEAVRGKKSVIRENISQVVEHIKNPQIPYTNKVLDLMKDVLVVMQQQIPVQKTAETSQLQFSNKVDEMPVAVQKHVPMVQTVQETVEIPQPECIDMVVDNPVVQVPRVQVLEKTAEITQLQTVEKIAETPQTQTIQGTQAAESSDITLVCQVAQTGHVEELAEVSRVFSQDTVQQRFGKQTIENPTESESPIFVTVPILENSPAEYMKPALTVT